ncbi:MAG: hypothetical protein WBG11_06875 [Methylocella sp.]
MTNIDFHSLTSARRCCLAHAPAWRKKKTRGTERRPFWLIVSVLEIAGASLFAARQESLPEQDLERQRSLCKALQKINFRANIRPRCRSIPFIRTVSLRLDHSISRVSGTNSGKGWTLSVFLDHPAKEQNDDAITE